MTPRTPGRRASDLLAPHHCGRFNAPWWPILGLPAALALWALLKVM